MKIVEVAVKAETKENLFSITLKKIARIADEINLKIIKSAYTLKILNLDNGNFLNSIIKAAPCLTFNSGHNSIMNFYSPCRLFYQADASAQTCKNKLCKPS